MKRARTDVAQVIWETSRADEGTISAMGADHVAIALEEAGMLASTPQMQAKAEQAILKAIYTPERSMWLDPDDVNEIVDDVMKAMRAL